MRFRKFKSILSLVVLMVLSVTIVAQEKSTTQRAIGVNDMLEWKTIRNTTLSENGKWLAYYLTPADGDAQLIIKNNTTEKELKFEVGQLKRSGSNPVSFSGDSKWAAFYSFPKKDAAKKAKSKKKILYNSVVLVNLDSSKKTIFKKITKFSFSNDNPEWIVLKRAAPESLKKEKKKWKGTDLIVKHLSLQSTFNIGNISEFGFNKNGNWLAMLVDAQDQIGNSVLLRNMKNGNLASVDVDSVEYKKINWTDSGDAFSVLKGKDDKSYKEKLYSIVGFKNFSESIPTKVSFNPINYEGFPENMTISPSKKVEWTDDLDAFIFGIHEISKKDDVKKEDLKKENNKESADSTKSKKNSKKEKISDDEIPGLVIWHWKDKRLQSMQQVQEKYDKNFSFLSTYRFNEKKFIQLADEKIKTVTLTPKQKWAVGWDDSPYEWMSHLDGRRYEDIYFINPKTGERKLGIKKCRWAASSSIDGSLFLYYMDGNYFTYKIDDDKIFNITKNVPVSFIDVEDDHNVIDPPIRPVGWSSDGTRVLLSDDWDIWSIDSEGKDFINLTRNGRKEKIRYQRRFRIDKEEKGIDLSKSLFFTAYGELTKKGGLVKINSKMQSPKILFWNDAVYSSLLKAKNANVYAYTKQTFNQYPNYFITDSTFEDSKQVTDANPQQKDFLWSSGTKIINYKSDKGVNLQAALYLPANYEKGKSYPTIVYYYEKMSQTLNRYFTPTVRGFNKSYYTSNGYAVLMPDIVYEINNPGMSAVWCVLPAIKAAGIDGVVDTNRIGIHGHSWGGYQTAFLVTQSKLFKAAVAGAPLTDLISMYNLIYWNTGTANQPIFESSQGRFTGGPWQNLDAYIRNSPLHYAKNVVTPLIILHNDKDGAVDFTQGIEYYNTLRRLKKEVIMLQYKGENHGLRKLENKIDYTVRMKEFFDHQLLGKPAPIWYKEGISHLKLKEHLKERVRALKKERNK